jgi:undecaprenyl-diphosphatase
MKKNNFWLVTALTTALLFIFLLISIKYSARWLTNLDTIFQKLITPEVKPTTTTYVNLIANLGSPISDLFWTGILAYYIWLKERKPINACWLVITQLTGCAVVLLIKELIQRPRPTDQIIKESGFSFPSGHTFATAILVFAILYLIVPRIQDQEIQFVISLLSSGWLILIGFTRLYLRAHFFSDVFGSVLLASCWWAIMRVCYSKFYRQIVNLAQSLTTHNSK